MCSHQEDRKTSSLPTASLLVLSKLLHARVNWLIDPFLWSISPFLFSYNPVEVNQLLPDFPSLSMILSLSSKYLQEG